MSDRKRTYVRFRDCIIKFICVYFIDLISDLELNDRVNNNTSPYMGKLSLLLQWHEQDPVDNFERRRNEIIYMKYQQNRNPFIDHPQWVQQIWK
ncbi:hypothetical protein COD86_26890 [Bacillus cereus]|nr:hypothetical protein COD14_29700 [Bacillus cereus]PGV90017.1 hypothetical protein COD86_26890 [Bacillus cereus]